MSKRVCMFTCVCRVWRPEEDVCVLLSFSPLYSLGTGSFPESGVPAILLTPPITSHCWVPGLSQPLLAQGMGSVDSNSDPLAQPVLFTH